MQKIKKMTKIRTIVLMLALTVIPSAAIAAENYMSLLDQIDKALTSRDWTLSERLKDGFGNGTCKSKQLFINVEFGDSLPQSRQTG